MLCSNDKHDAELRETECELRIIECQEKIRSDLLEVCIFECGDVNFNVSQKAGFQFNLEPPLPPEQVVEVCIIRSSWKNSWVGVCNLLLILQILNHLLKIVHVDNSYHVLCYTFWIDVVNMCKWISISKIIGIAWSFSWVFPWVF